MSGEGGHDPLPPLRDMIAAHGLSARRALGQNFLLDLNLTRRIARAGGPLAANWVYEVGPGPGGLTRALLTEGAAHVVAVERDERCLPVLAEVSSAWPGRLDVVPGDAMSVDEAALLRERGAALPVRVAANLPYNVGTALLVKWLTAKDWPPWWSSLTLMFQREVAERLVAQPGEEGYGRLSVLTAWRATPKILFDVSRQAFVPPPNVTSTVVRIEPLAAPRFEADLKSLEAITASGFGQRRKMLRVSLKSLVKDAQALLDAAGIPGTARAEELDLAQFCALARAYVSMKSMA